MTTKTKGIPTAIIAYEYDRWGRSETRQVIDALKVFEAIEPYLPGSWRVVERTRDDTETVVKRVRNVTIERESDGTRVCIWPEWGDRETRIRVNPDTHYYGATREYRDSIDDGWLYRAHGGKPSATIDISKRNAKAIANDISRRVIEVAAKVLPKVRELQKDRAERDERCNRAVSIAKAAKNVLVRPHYNDNGAQSVEIIGSTVSGVIRRGSTDVYVERLYLPVDALAEFAALVRKYKAKD